MTPGPFSYELVDGGRRLVLRGELDEAGSSELRDVLGTTWAALVGDTDATLDVDLSQVDFLPSAGVGVLARARGEARKVGVELVLIAAEGTVAQRVLTICRLPHVTA